MIHRISFPGYSYHKIISILFICFCSWTEIIVASQKSCSDLSNFSEHIITIKPQEDPQEIVKNFCNEKCLNFEMCRPIFPVVRNEVYEIASEIQFYQPLEKRVDHTVSVSITVDRTAVVEIVYDSKDISIVVGPEDNVQDLADNLCTHHSISPPNCNTIQEKMHQTVEGICRTYSCNHNDQESSSVEIDFSLLEEECPLVYVDLGSNNGKSIVQDVIQYSPESPLSTWFQTNVWKNGTYQLSDLCIYGFEGNPVFEEDLIEVEVSLSDIVGGIKIFKDTIVGPKNGHELFFLDTHSSTHYGSSVRMEHRDIFFSDSVLNDKPTAIKVKSVRLSEFLQKISLEAHTIIVKMDIEGAEYPILVDFLTSGFACDPLRKASFNLLLELHPFVLQYFFPEVPSDFVDSVLYLLENCGINIHQDDGVTDSSVPLID